MHETCDTLRKSPMKTQKRRASKYSKNSIIQALTKGWQANISHIRRDATNILRKLR